MVGAITCDYPVAVGLGSLILFEKHMAYQMSSGQGREWFSGKQKEWLGDQVGIS